MLGSRYYYKIWYTHPDYCVLFYQVLQEVAHWIYMQ